MVGGNTKHGGDSRQSGNTRLKPRKPPMQVRRVKPAKKLLTKSLGSLSFTYGDGGAIKEQNFIYCVFVENLLKRVYK